MAAITPTAVDSVDLKVIVSSKGFGTEHYARYQFVMFYLRKSYCQGDASQLRVSWIFVPNLHGKDWLVCRVAFCDDAIASRHNKASLKGHENRFFIGFADVTGFHCTAQLTLKVHAHIRLTVFGLGNISRDGF